MPKNIITEIRKNTRRKFSAEDVQTPGSNFGGQATTFTSAAVISSKFLRHDPNCKMPWHGIL
ncbi:MAG: hypothetical protein K8S55_09420 [Phycisphaerae bacterium]|nr:hypothetical protein [Phycisphaerae bacterium]